MWRILNKLFGWDYIYWESSCNYGISIIRSSYQSGKPYYIKYGSGIIVQVNDHNDVIWLTCHPSKYLNTAGIRQEDL